MRIIGNAAASVPVRSDEFTGCIKRGQFCGPGQIFINDKLTACGEWKGAQLLKSFELDKGLVKMIETEVASAEQAGSSAKLAASDSDELAGNGQASLIADCTSAAVAKAAAAAEAARLARASRQVISRPSSSLSVAQALHDADQVARLAPLLLKHCSVLALMPRCRQTPALQAMRLTARLKMAVAVRKTNQQPRMMR